MKLILCLLAFSVFGQATFTSGPTAVLNNGKVDIGFTVSASTDVEVAVVDGGGKIIRHLAAGVLGGQYDPPPPLAAGLSQAIQWDLADDRGLTVADGDYTVRVRLGVRPVWKYFINTRPIPGTHNATPYVPRAWEKTILRSHPIFPRITNEINPKLYLAVNDVYEKVYVRVGNDPSITTHIFDGFTGQPLDTIFTLPVNYQWIYWGEIGHSWDGLNFYHTTTAGAILRYTHEGMPTYWPAKPGVIGRVGMLDTFYLSHTHARGHAVGPNNYLYMLHHPTSAELDFSNEYSVWQQGTVAKIDSFGRDIQRNFIEIHAMCSGIRLDAQGNIYIGARVKPANQLVPAYVDSLIDPADTAWDGLRWWADEMYGSLLKFGPSGGGLFQSATGALEAGKDIPVPGVSRYRLREQGLIWAYYGIDPVTTHYGHRRSDAMKFPTRGAICLCNVQRFDVDRFGRIFMPDPFVLSIKAIDNNRNAIFNFDHLDMTAMLTQMGQMGTAPLMGWPHDIDATDHAIYVADQMNNQIVCFGLEADDTAQVTLAVVALEAHKPGATFTFGLYRNTPNPFYTNTAVKYQIAGAGRDHVRLAVYDLGGKLVRTLVNAEQGKGVRTVRWDGRDDRGLSLASGVYVLRLAFGKRTQERRMIMLK